MPKKSEKKQHNCWQKIGVWSNKSPRCEILDEVIHCRNCHIFHDASLKAYEQKFPDDYRKEWTTLLSRHKDKKSGNIRAVIVFRVADEWMALAARLCGEITNVSAIHRIPHNKNKLLKGLVSSEGKIQPCFSLGVLMGLSKSNQKENEEKKTIYERVIVLEKEGNNFAFPVNEIDGIYYFKEDELEDLPETMSGMAASFLEGIIRLGDKCVGFLDDELIISKIERSLQ